MKIGSIRWFLTGVFALWAAAGVFGQPSGTQDAETRTRRNAIEAELRSIAVVERKVMVPMFTGRRMQRKSIRSSFRERRTTSIGGMFGSALHGT